MNGDAGDRDGPVRVAFVCVQNAGRSQMAAALAAREIERRGLGRAIEVVSGGTDPADHVHAGVIEAMREEGIDLADRTPRTITPADLARCDVVITMGCSAGDVCPATWRGDARDWALPDPAGADSETVVAIRDEIASRVRALLDELVA